MRFWLSRLLQIKFLGGGVLCLICMNLFADNVTDERTDYNSFHLMEPRTSTKVVSGKMTFIWEKHESLDSVESLVDRYEINFWHPGRDFRKKFSVSPGDSTSKSVSFVLKECRKVFRRHGKYYWQVTAINVNEMKTFSEIRSFSICARNVGNSFKEESYVYEIRYQYTHRLHTPEYKTFINNLSQNTNMRSYSDMSLIFRQQGVGSSLFNFCERVFILSNVGIGFEVSSRYKLLKNRYFSIQPRFSITSSWYSSGLQNYTSNLYSVSMGCDFVIMPSANVTLRTCLIPTHRIRYSEKGGELRTYQGNGWEIGVRVIIPHKILKTLHIFGREVDFERIPIEFHMRYIEDEYTGTLMKIRQFSIGYLL